MDTEIVGKRRSRSSAGAARRTHELSALFDTEYARLRGLAFVLLGDAFAAEEAVMEAFVKTFSSWSTRRLDSPAAYLTRVVVNECRGVIRRRRLELRSNALAERRRERIAPSWEAGGSDTRLDVWAAVRTLPGRQRACIALRYLEGLNDSEIAETLDCSIGTVKSHMSRARRSLQRALGRPEEVPR